MTFYDERQKMSIANWNNKSIRAAAKNWHDASRSADYQYMFNFCGLPIIQDPQDICMLQEIIWDIKPTLIVETGIAHGGSLLLSAMSLAALSFIDAQELKSPIRRRVIGIDIDIREHNKREILAHPLSFMISLIQGSSIDKATVEAVKTSIAQDDTVLIILDSNHTEDHVFAELMMYSDFVSRKSAMIVMDTGIEFASPESFKTSRPWSIGNNPYTATKKFLETEKGKGFLVERDIEIRHLITSAPEGLLRRK